MKNRDQRTDFGQGVTALQNLIGMFCFGLVILFVVFIPYWILVGLDEDSFLTSVTMFLHVSL